MTKTKYKKAVVECCRNWIVVTEILTWNTEFNDWDRSHPIGYGHCGYCKEFPKLVGTI